MASLWLLLGILGGGVPPPVLQTPDFRPKNVIFQPFVDLALVFQTLDSAICINHYPVDPEHLSPGL